MIHTVVDHFPRQLPLISSLPEHPCHSTHQKMELSSPTPMTCNGYVLCQMPSTEWRLRKYWFSSPPPLLVSWEQSSPPIHATEQEETQLAGKRADPHQLEKSQTREQTSQDWVSYRIWKYWAGAFLWFWACSSQLLPSILFFWACKYLISSSLTILLLRLSLFDLFLSIPSHPRCERKWEASSLHECVLCLHSRAWGWRLKCQNYCII